jgi:hypothetical protein
LRFDRFQLIHPAFDRSVTPFHRHRSANRRLILAKPSGERSHSGEGTPFRSTEPIGLAGRGSDFGSGLRTGRGGRSPRGLHDRLSTRHYDAADPPPSGPRLGSRTRPPAFRPMGSRPKLPWRGGGGLSLSAAPSPIRAAGRGPRRQFCPRGIRSRPARRGYSAGSGILPKADGGRTRRTDPVRWAACALGTNPGKRPTGHSARRSGNARRGLRFST